MDHDYECMRPFSSRCLAQPGEQFLQRSFTRLNIMFQFFERVGAARIFE